MRGKMWCGMVVWCGATVIYRSSNRRPLGCLVLDHDDEGLGERLVAEGARAVARGGRGQLLRGVSTSAPLGVPARGCQHDN